jgi:4-hydroxy-tetrahydrodipicolinate reductase
MATAAAPGMAIEGQEQSRVLVVGALGRMGTLVRAAVARAPDLSVAAALERKGHPLIGKEIEEGVVLTDDITSALAGCDVAIDFSIPASTLKNLRASAAAGVAYVTGTTGFSATEKQEIEALARRIPVVVAANFSVAVNVLGWLAREAARLLGEGYDAELFEIHHTAKRDAPSGTALMLAERVAEGRDQRLDERVILARSGDIGPRPEGAIAIQTLRGGDNPGEHTLYFAGRGERIELVHRSTTRDHFAAGAVRAAQWLLGRPPGLYPIGDVLELPD